MVYCSNFVCTYRQLENDDAYRAQLLQAFGIREYNFDAIERALIDLIPLIKDEMKPVYKLLRHEKTILGHLLLSMASKMDNDLDLCLCLCSIETFDYFHALICSVVNRSEDIEEKVNVLVEALKV